MRALILLILLFLFAAPGGIAQRSAGNTLSGKITDSATGKPLAGVSVFLNNTSRGTITRDDGSFLLENVFGGTYDLVISAVSYATYVITVNSDHLPSSLKVALHRQAEELTAVMVAPDLRHGWRDWGKYFIENFIGRTLNAEHCRILNRKVLRFYYSKKNQRLTVRATEPLRIRNNALGYEMEYRLESFVSDFRSNIVSYYGYPFFRDMTTANKRRQQEWEQNRETAYNGSMMHFIRSLYAGRLEKDNFIVVREIRVPNEEKRRVETVNKKVIVPSDSLLAGSTDRTKTLVLKDKLTIIFQPGLYNRQSTLESTGAHPVTIEENGQYYPPDEILTSGYWGFNEKVCNLLPLDYSVPRMSQ